MKKSIFSIFKIPKSKAFLYRSDIPLGKFGKIKLLMFLF